MKFGSVVEIEGRLTAENEKGSQKFMEITRIGEKNIEKSFKMEVRGFDRHAQGVLNDALKAGAVVRLIVYERVVCMGIPEEAYRHLEGRIPQARGWRIDTSLTVLNEVEK